MEMIVAPSRAFKTVSMWILMLTGIGDLAHLMLTTMTDLNYLTPQQLTLANAVLVFFAGAAKLVQQNIAMTPDQKSDAIERIQDAPDKAPKEPSVPKQEPT